MSLKIQKSKEIYTILSKNDKIFPIFPQNSPKLNKFAILYKFSPNLYSIPPLTNEKNRSCFLHLFGKERETKKVSKSNLKNENKKTVEK